MFYSVCVYLPTCLFVNLYDEKDSSMSKETTKQENIISHITSSQHLKY